MEFVIKRKFRIVFIIHSIGIIGYNH